MPRLKLLQSRVAREKAARGESLLRQRLPTTPPLLLGMLDHWTATTTPPSNSTAISFDFATLRAAATMCFFGFFRSGEITVPSHAAFDERRLWRTHPSRVGDVTVDEASPPPTVQVHLKHSKCDQLGRGVNVFLGRTSSPACPVTEIVRFVSLRGPAPGPFFHFADGSPLTKAVFVNHVRTALSTMGVTASAYAGHSFRIGAATAVAEAGLEDSVIHLLGWWNSDAFLRYVRTLRETLAGFTARLAPASPTPSTQPRRAWCSLAHHSCRQHHYFDLHFMNCILWLAYLIILHITIHRSDLH